MVRRRRSGSGLILVAVAALAVPLARAQGPILHEYVPDVTSDESALLLFGGGRDEPAAIVYEGEVLPAPNDGALRPDERPITAEPAAGDANDPAQRPSPTYRPDRLTSLESSPGYYAVFTPMIAPFKRVTALDAIAVDAAGTPFLRIHSMEGRDVPIVGVTAPAPDPRPRDRFWGSVVVDFSAGTRVPLPSVSPESRILTLRTEPETAVRVEKDGADNFYLVLDAARRPRQVRVVFLTDAPQSYFNTPVPDVRSDALSGEVPPIPEGVRRRAERFAGELGLRRGQPLPMVLDALVGHFRSFEESDDPPDDTGDIYLDLSRGRRGVCRHRAYGFVITAQALGIPSRFVQNEAHAWVEVKMATVGWMRIDLGGSARGLEARNAEDRPRYRPREPDPMPQPEAYQRAYAELQQRMGAREESAGGGSASSGGGVLAGGNRAGGTAEQPAWTGNEPASLDRPEAAGSEDRPLEPLGITLDRTRFDVFRGRALEVSGRLVDRGGRGVSGLRVEVALGGSRERLLGVTVSRENGWFRGSFGVPPDAPVGDYRLLVRTPGSDRYAAAVAR